MRDPKDLPPVSWSPSEFPARRAIASGGLKIAVIGAGISGLTAARILSARHEVTIFEGNDYPGGHTHTQTIDLSGLRWTVDTGFIVYNERAYPNFVRMLAALGVATRPTSMSFGVRCERTGLEYGGRTLAGVFAQKRNLIRPRFWTLLRDVRRFGSEAGEIRGDGDDSSGAGGEGPGLVNYLRERGYSREFIELYAVPMGAAIWSARPEAIESCPARHFVRFFEHHGVLDTRSAPMWRTIVGGSHRYVERLLAPLKCRLHLNDAVARVTRRPDGVIVRTRKGCEGTFDRAVIAAHSDQALAMLERPTPAESEILAALRYEENEATLHTDARTMPRRRRAWSSWNYLVPAEAQQGATVTYYMNLLQGIPCPEPLLVSLNGSGRIDPARILRRMRYHHPITTHEALSARRRHGEIDGVDRIHYCGAYWGYGFHEDGVDSALAVSSTFGLGLDAIG